MCDGAFSFVFEAVYTHTSIRPARTKVVRCRISVWLAAARRAADSNVLVVGAIEVVSAISAGHFVRSWLVDARPCTTMRSASRCWAFTRCKKL